MMRLLIVLLFLSTVTLPAAPKFVELPGDSPLVTFRAVFLTGAASDPADRPGLAALTASMLSDAGTKKMSYDQIVEAMFPMATSVSSQIGKEMTTFTAVTHVDNLEAFYAIFHDMLLDPGWREDDLKRLRDQHMNYLRVSLRGNNDEELGKEVLYQAIYDGHPYYHHNMGSVSGIEAITMEDLQAFYRQNYTQANLVFGIAGGYPGSFLARVKKDLAKLPKGKEAERDLPQPKKIDGLHVRMIEKNTRSVAYSFGFPISVVRGDPDYAALLVAKAYLGQHRNGGRLFDRIREERGLNYGDYAYIEYFPRGMFQFEPDPNIARPQQIFQIWIRPVEPDTAHFTLRLAMYELDKFIKEGISETDFRRTRSFLSKYVNLLIKTKDAELGYAIDSQYYGIPDYTTYIQSELAKLTREDVDRAIRKHLRTDDLWIAVVAKDSADLKKRFLAGEPSPMTYNSEKPEEILEEDKIVQKWPIPFEAEKIEIVPVSKVFE